MSGGVFSSPDWRTITLARLHYYKTLHNLQLIFQMKIDTDELVSQQVAAKMRGLASQTINKLMKRGRFTVIEISGIRFLLRKEVEAYKPSVGGRPRKHPPADQSSQGSTKAKRRRASKTTPAKKKPSR